MQTLPLQTQALRARYLELVKRCVGDFLYDFDPEDDQATPYIYQDAQGRERALSETGLQKIYGMAPRRLAHTIIGLRRLNQLQTAVETVLREGVPGDLIETGILRGGAIVFMRAILEAYGVRDRIVWAADSFIGFPPRVMSPGAEPEQRFYDWAVPQAVVEQNIQRYGLFDRQIRMLPGWFADTLPAAPMEKLAILRLDGDLYPSTMDALTHLYPRLSPGGYCIIDDYLAFAECRAAVDEYRLANAIDDPITLVDKVCIYWRKGSNVPRLVDFADSADEAARLHRLYLDLLKLSLIDALYDVDRPAGEPGAYDRLKRQGRIASATAHTLIGLPRLNQLQSAVESILEEGIPGDLIEAGVLRGGAGLFLRALLLMHESGDRMIWLADSFCGPPDRPGDPLLAAKNQKNLEELFFRYDLPEDQIRILPGWFSETLPSAPIERLALLRIDAAHAPSTLQVLEALYERLSPGGYCIIDDYLASPDCRAAVDAYRARQGIQDALISIDADGVYWRKG